MSAAVISLESYMSVPLFRRLPRGVELTAEGRLLYEEVQPAFDRLQSLMQILSRRRSADELVLTMLASFAQNWLLPRLEHFRTVALNVGVRIYTDRRILDLGANRIHAGIRFGRGEWPGVRVQRLFDDWAVAVCSSAYARRASRMRTPADLLHGHCRIESSSESWEEWFEQARVKGRSSPAMFAFDDAGLTLAAARAGLGVALVRWSYAHGDLAAGTLKLAVPHSFRTEYSYYPAWPPAIEMHSAFVVFRQWLLEEARSFPVPPAAEGRGAN